MEDELTRLETLTDVLSAASGWESIKDFCKKKKKLNKIHPVINQLAPRGSSQRQLVKLRLIMRQCPMNQPNT